jgi:hypothetical protein
MSQVIDNGNAHAPSLGDAWTPRLNGEVFCSPACGYKCKKADFDRASERVTALVSQLGAGWRPEVWENGGWYFEAKKGLATVSPEDNGHFTASIRFMFNDAVENLISATRSDPREAVGALIEQLSRRIATLSRALVSVSLSPVEISDI